MIRGQAHEAEHLALRAKWRVAARAPPAPALRLKHPSRAFRYLGEVLTRRSMDRRFYSVQVPPPRSLANTDGSLS